MDTSIRNHRIVLLHIALYVPLDDLIELLEVLSKGWSDLHVVKARGCLGWRFIMSTDNNIDFSLVFVNLKKEGYLQKAEQDISLNFSNEKEEMWRFV